MASQTLWEQALEAKSRGDLSVARKSLWGWMTLQSEMRALPSPFEELSDALIEKLQAEGPLRIYGSRMTDRVRVAVSDPAGVVGRVQVFLKTPTAWRMLTRLESHAVSRFEYGEVGTLTKQDFLKIEAYMLWPNADVLVRRIHLYPEETRIRPSASIAHTSSASEDCAVSRSCSELESMNSVWWTLALGVLAIGFAGGAVWQELRFSNP